VKRILVAAALLGCSRNPEAATVENRAPPPGPAPEAMVYIPGGEFSMGSDEAVDARPIHRVYVDGFWMDRTEVTNGDFAAFVRDTGYVTVAEREVPAALPEQRVPGSTVFTPPRGPVPLDDHLRWWSWVQKADWRHPAGPGSDLEGRERYPVVHVAYDDAAAYATWAGKRLPTEAEFEFAARGGLAGARYAWGDELHPDGKWMANTFQGHFPDRDDGDDGWAGLAPVASFPPNRYGLYDIAGNVWEWCSDWYRADYYRRWRGLVRNPTGPDGGDERVQRGGSFLCTSQYCARYLVGTRGRGDPSAASNHLGFRCVR
jgi:formylglycine-generating enzyme